MVLCKLKLILQDKTYARTYFHFGDVGPRHFIACREVSLCWNVFECIISSVLLHTCTGSFHPSLHTGVGAVADVKEQSDKDYIPKYISK